MNQSSHEDDEPVLIEAADWFAKARGPEAARWAPELAAWRQERPENEAAYIRLLQNWERSAFLANSKTARSRNLRSVSTWSRRPLARNAAIAAGLLLVVSLATMVAKRPGWSGTAAPAVSVAGADHAVRTIGLAKGSLATLDAGSAMEIHTEAGAQHIRLVRGRVRFEVGPQAAPIAVDTGGGTVESRSGVFDVSLTGRSMTVVVWQGVLNVRGNLRSASWSSRMAPGQQLVFDPTRGAPSMGLADRGQRGWTRGMLSFEQTRLADAVRLLNRYNQTQIKLSPQVGDLRVTGAFHANDPGGFARVVGDMFGLMQERSIDGTISLSPGIKT